MRIGSLSLEAAVVDISLGGVGTLVYDSGVHLEPGMRIPGARIVHGSNPPVTVDLEIRYVSPAVGRDGRQANRAGCIVYGSRGKLEELVHMFIADLGAK
jgi:hypothetical protein